MRLLPPLLLLLTIAATTTARADDIYVSTTGSNGNSGDIDSPYRDIGYAVDQAGRGDTVFVRGGEYNEIVEIGSSGTAAERITIKNYANEIAIIDGAGIAVGGETALVEISSESYITLDGFHIRNLTTSTNSRTPLGILIKRDSIGIEILNCEIYDIRNTGSDGNAHGILVSGDRSTPISDLVIRGNELRDLVLGNSEALVLNGNVDGFEVSDNHVHDCNNLGIDFIGFEGTAPAGSIDQARNGVCSDNVVNNISTIANPAYNGPSAAGIYVDGGRDIIIERNHVISCDIGIELASEDPNGSTSNITVRSNMVWRNLIGGIFVGGYQQNRGAATDCMIVGNTLYQNDTRQDYNGEILVQHNTSNLVVYSNIMFANSQKLFVQVQNNASNTGIELDYNLYYSNSATNPSASEWLWYSTEPLLGFNAWKSTSGQDRNSIYSDPEFTDTGTFDLTLTEDSPAIDRGDPSYIPSADETDAFDNPRISGNFIDTGAHEFVFLSELQQWRMLHFGTTENSGDAANLADPDFDQLTNLMEFALAGQDPNYPDNEAAVTPTPRGIQFTLNPDATAEITYLIEAAGDLKDWFSLAIRAAGQNWVNQSDTLLSESMGKVIFLDARTLPGSAHFYRLKITIP